MTAPGSDKLLVAVRDRTYELATTETFTFGRHETCTCCLDPDDRGISRLAGSIGFENGTWWVVNRSESRTLHIVDALGLTAPLPVARPGWPPPTRVIDQSGLRILVAGGVWTHEIRCTFPDPSVVTSVQQPHGEKTVPLPGLTENRRFVLVAMVSGYLRPGARYSPSPLTYQQIADLTGIKKTTVQKRVEVVRDKIRELGVRGLDEGDARRGMAEWLLAAHVIVPEDLAWFERKLKAGDLTTGDDDEDG